MLIPFCHITNRCFVHLIGFKHTCPTRFWAMPVFCCSRVSPNRSIEACATTPLLGGEHGDLLCAFSQWARGKSHVKTPHNGRGYMVRVVRYAGCRERTRAIPPSAIIEWQRFYGLSRDLDSDHVVFRDISKGQSEDVGDILATRAMRCCGNETHPRSNYVLYVHSLIVPSPPPPISPISTEIPIPVVAQLPPPPRARVTRANSIATFVSHRRLSVTAFIAGRRV